MKTFTASLTKKQASILLNLIDSETNEYFAARDMTQVEVADLYLAIDEAFQAAEDDEILNGD